MTDFLIRNARVVDGTGAPVFTADVRVEKGRITAVGPSLPPSGTVIDAGGRYLAPGFIDAHCHDDLICLRDSLQDGVGLGRVIRCHCLCFCSLGQTAGA